MREEASKMKNQVAKTLKSRVQNLEMEREFKKKKTSEKPESVYSANEIRPRSAYSKWNKPEDMM